MGEQWIIKQVNINKSTIQMMKQLADISLLVEHWENLGTHAMGECYSVLWLIIFCFILQLYPGSAHCSVCLLWSFAPPQPPPREICVTALILWIRDCGDYSKLQEIWHTPQEIVWFTLSSALKKRQNMRSHCMTKVSNRKQCHPQKLQKQAEFQLITVEWEIWQQLGTGTTEAKTAVRSAFIPTSQVPLSCLITSSASEWAVCDLCRVPLVSVIQFWTHREWSRNAEMSGSSVNIFIIFTIHLSFILHPSHGRIIHLTICQ